jgi:DNA-binding CsgD family transcriptional regulator
VLEFLGIDRAVEKVYRAMLDHPEDGVEQLAEHCGQTPEQVIRSLDQLIGVQLIQPSREDTGRFRAVSPKVGLTALLRDQQVELQRQQESYLAARMAVQSLISENELRDGTDIVPLRRSLGMDSVQAILENLAQSAETECLSLMPGGAQSPASLAGSRPLDEAALRRGVALRTVYLDSARKDQATMAYARWTAGEGGEVRTVPTLATRLVIVDRRVALLPFDPNDSRKGIVQAEEPGIVAAMVAWFEEIWTSATPIDSVPAENEDGVTPQERELLRLLGQGLTDEMASRRLGVSLRTTRRMMAEIMGRLGAQSRFEAGKRAAERGWVTSSGGSPRRVEP